MTSDVRPATSGLCFSSHSIEQVGDVHAEPMRETSKDAHPRVTLATLDPADIGEGEPAGVGYLLLREAAFGADSTNVSAEAVEGVAGHGGIVVA